MDVVIDDDGGDWDCERAAFLDGGGESASTSSDDNLLEITAALNPRPLTFNPAYIRSDLISLKLSPALLPSS